MKSIFIFRRDFRINDNIGLLECYKNSSIVYPIFIFTPEQIKTNDYKSDNAVQFMIESLKDLNQQLDGKLNLFYGNYLDIIKQLKKDLNIDAVFTNTDYSPYAIERDEKIEKLCEKEKLEFVKKDDILLFKPGSLKQYKVFTPYYNFILTQKIPKKVGKIKKEKVEKVEKLKNQISFDDTKKFYQHNDNLNVKGGRKEGKKILKNIKNFKDYQITRDIMNKKTTELSGYLKFGCLSVREVSHKIIDTLGLKHPLYRQIIWREFHYQLEYYNRERFGYNMIEKWDKLKWTNNKKNLELWKEGKTGYPIVDAAMRQMNETGFMHNRGRMITASFLSKNLRIDWREGEKYFAQKLLDYDVYVNNSNFQNVVSVSFGASPYFRIFNLFTQSKKFDKDCEYIKKWIPELKNVTNNDIHTWDVSYKKYPFAKYPKPIIDYKESRKKTLEMYKAV